MISNDRPIPVLYDGWPLIDQPAGPASTHLFALLAALLAAVPDRVAPLLALPAEPPPSLSTLPGVKTVVEKAAEEELPTRWLWEQRTLPELARRAGARLIHLTHSHPPLLAGVPTVVSPTAPKSGLRVEGGFSGRLRRAAAGGGMSRLAGLLWPEDLPEPPGASRVVRLPPLPLPGLDPSEPQPEAPASLKLPETFLLAHGPRSRREALRLLDVWSWGAGPIGQLYPLVVLGAGRPAQETIQEELSRAGVSDSIRLQEGRNPGEVAWFYRRCTAVLHPWPTGPWGSPVRYALTAGRPLVTTTDPLNDALVGPAAYTVPASDPRRMGAALITTVVEEEVATRLSEAAHRRAAAWRRSDYGERLHQTYRHLITAK